MFIVTHGADVGHGCHEGGGGLIPHDERRVERMQSKDVKNMNVSDKSVLLMAQNGSAAKMDTPIVALS